MSDLIAVQREESFLVRQAQAQGLPVEHRADMSSPLALLGLRLVTTPRAGPPPNVATACFQRRRRSAVTEMRIQLLRANSADGGARTDRLSILGRSVRTSITDRAAGNVGAPPWLGDLRR